MATTKSTLIHRFALALLATAATGAATASCTGDAYLLSVFPGNGHGAPWAPMYSNPDMYRWLLAHGRP